MKGFNSSVALQNLTLPTFILAIGLTLMKT